MLTDSIECLVNTSSINCIYSLLEVCGTHLLSETAKMSSVIKIMKLINILNNSNVTLVIYLPSDSLTESVSNTESERSLHGFRVSKHLLYSYLQIFYKLLFTILTNVAYAWSRNSSGSIVSGYVLDDRAIGFRSPAGAKDFSSSLCVQTGSGVHPASCTMGTRGPFPGAKHGRDVALTTHPI
jgi:hypothetical protein